MALRGTSVTLVGAFLAFHLPAAARAEPTAAELASLFVDLCVTPRTTEDMLNAAGRVAAGRSWPQTFVGRGRLGLHGFLPGVVFVWTVAPKPSEILFFVSLVDPELLPDVRMTTCAFLASDNQPGADDLVPVVDRVLAPGMVKSRARPGSAETKHNWFTSPDGKRLTDCGRHVAVIDNIGGAKRVAMLTLADVAFPKDPPWNELSGTGRCPAQPD